MKNMKWQVKSTKKGGGGGGGGKIIKETQIRKPSRVTPPSSMFPLQKLITNNPAHFRPSI